jgi:C4-dicarboxylate-specific signal transduction histidine kinase
MIYTERTLGDHRLKSTLLQSGVAVLLVAGALGVTLLLQSVVSTAGYIFFYIAVVTGTWFAGKWAGSLTVILGTLAVEYYFIPPIHSIAVSRQSIPIFIEFAVSAIMVGWFSSWRKEAEVALQQARNELQLRVEERTAELKRTNEQLLDEISERKRAEDAYYEAQTELARVTRISALGTLAASISHEVNQPLAAVVTNADACMMWLSSDPPNLDEARLAVDCIAQQGTRASDVVRRIRAMFTKGGSERSRVRINDLILEVSALMEADAIRSRVTLRTELVDDLPDVLADRVQLQQVLVNLIQNGVEAMSTVDNRPRHIIIRSEMQAADEVLVAVRDCGPGIAPKDQKRIFDTFFTTKPQGMGMGLSISHSIIEAHGGLLWAGSNSDSGATLQFTLPAHRKVAS